MRRILPNRPSVLALAALLILVALMVRSARAQATLTGSVLDEEEAPVALANVRVLNAADSTFVAGTVADEDGVFAVDRISPGRYRLFVTLIGYEDYVSDILEVVDENDVEAGTIRLESTAIEMEGVAVEARRTFYEQKGDRLVVNVATSLTAAGQSALKVLKRSPGVLVNEQSGTVSLIGKDGVTILMNGKRSYVPADGIVQFLAGISADNVESIELITSPPAHLDAEGNAGFINIVLKESVDTGLNGSVSLSGGYGDGEVGSASGNITYQRENVSLSANYSFLLNGRDQFWTNYRRITTEESVLETPTSAHRQPLRMNHDLRAMLEYELDASTTVGGLIGAYDHKWTMNAVNRMRSLRDGTPMVTIHSDNDEINHWRHAMGNVYVHRKLGSEGSIRADFDYVYYYDDNPTVYVNTISNVQTGEVIREEQESDKNTPLHITVAKVDYETTASDVLDVEIGVKGSFSRFTNESTFQGSVKEEYVGDAGLGSTSILREDVLAGYGTTEYRATDAVTLKAGLRYEFTDSNLRSEDEKNLVDRRFGSLFPSLAYSHKLTDEQSINASYTRRITRPSFTDMAPFLYFIDPFTFFTGNAALQPAIIQTVKLDFTYKSLLASVQYAWEDSTISRFQSRVIKEDNVQLLFPRNYSSMNQATALIALPIHPTGWWSTQNNVMAIWTELSGFSHGNVFETSRTSLRLNSTQNFSLPHDFDLELSGFYQGPTLSGIYRMAPAWGVDVAVHRVIPGNNGTLSLSVEDAFDTVEWQFTTRGAEDEFYLDTNVDFSTRTIRLTYSLRFGDGKTGAARETASSEERGRVQD